MAFFGDPMVSTYQRVTCELCARMLPRYSGQVFQIITKAPGEVETRERFLCMKCRAKVISLFPSLNVVDTIVPADPGKRIVEV